MDQWTRLVWFKPRTKPKKLNKMDCFGFQDEMVRFGLRNLIWFASGFTRTKKDLVLHFVISLFLFSLNEGCLNSFCPLFFFFCFFFYFSFFFPFLFTYIPKFERKYLIIYIVLLGYENQNCKTCKWKQTNQNTYNFPWFCLVWFGY